MTVIILGIIILMLFSTGYLHILCISDKPIYTAFIIDNSFYKSPFHQPGDSLFLGTFLVASSGLKGT